MDKERRVGDRRALTEWRKKVSAYVYWKDRVKFSIKRPLIERRKGERRNDV